MRFASLLLVPTTLALMTVSATGTVIVDLNGGGDYLTLAEGIAAVAPGDTVLVAAGVYTGELNRDLSFGGKNITVKAMPEDTVTLDAEYLGRCFIFDSGESSLARVERLVMQNGSASDGGGVVCDGVVSPTFVSCTFTGCEATRGGAVDC
jgi:hypothetical protein